MQMNRTERKRKAQPTNWKPAKSLKSDRNTQHDESERVKHKKKKKIMDTNQDHSPSSRPFITEGKPIVSQKGLPTLVKMQNAKTSKSQKGRIVTTLAKKKSKPEKQKEKGQPPSKPVEVIELPKSAEEISSNWRQLQQMLSGDSARRQKRQPSKWKQKSKLTPVTPAETTSTPDIWFDDVDDIFIDTLKASKEAAAPTTTNPLTKQNMYTGITKVVAMDCEMVGVGDGQESILARVSIVNHDGYILYDKFVQPREKVTDYRTFVSGVRPEDLENAHPFETVQKEVADLLKDRILVGHALHNDIKVLFLSHPRKDTRDTAKFKPFRHLVGGRTPSLKKLAKELLGVEVQSGEHSSVQDAQAAMRIYTMHRKDWEKHIKDSRRGKFRKKRGNPAAASTDS